MRLALERFRQGLDKAPDFIPLWPIHRQLCFAVGQMVGESGRILIAHVDHPCLGGKDRARLVRVAAEGDHLIKLRRPQLGGRLGEVPQAVHARFSHDAHSMGIQAVFLDAR